MNMLYLPFIRRRLGIPPIISGKRLMVTAKSDFDHHCAGLARLNHGSFGATPAPVLAVQEQMQKSWLENPDEWYFSGRLHDKIRKAAQCAGSTLTNESQPENDNVCLVENGTLAACAVAYHWSKQISPGDVVIYLNIAYKACIHILKEYCESRGAVLIPIDVPFLAPTEEIILASVKQQLLALANQKLHPSFAFIDHVTSQPAMLLPVKKIIELIREYGSSDVEICLDGAHAVGSVPHLNVLDLNCDYYFANLHKWGFAPPTATVLWSKKLPEMRHPVVSWAWGEGMSEESLFPGSRDFSAFLAVPAAVEYLNKWEKDGMNSAEYCHTRVIEAANQLRLDWGVTCQTPNGETDDSLVATQAMVRLPSDLVVHDAPGQVSRGVRDLLRQEYKIEASIGNFGKEKGAYVRLSWAVYNDMEEIRRLSRAVVNIIQSQCGWFDQKPAAATAGYKQ